jgi:type VI secretion system protein ImpK
VSDNPFSEPDDNERTIIRPIPGGRRAGAVPRVEDDPTLTNLAAISPGEGGARFADLPIWTASPVVAAASGCLSLLGRLRNAFSVPDPTALREHAVQELKRFEAILRGQNLPMEQLRPAHYALCASLDDVVQATPWGSRGAWADASLVSTFHQEVRSGERFFDLLAQLRQNPGKFLQIVELMYLCMSLGMQGRYRLSPRGPAELDRVREETYVLIARARPPVERALSPHWQGVSAPYRRQRFVLPLWVAALIGLALAALVYVWASLGLAADSDRLFTVGLGLPPGKMPEIARNVPVESVVTLPSSGARDALAGFLKPEIDQGLVSIVGTDAVPIVRIRNRGMFASGSADVEARFRPILTRIGAALRTQPGTVQVVGYTDDQPIHTIRFPSNFELSTARANAAAAVIGPAAGLGAHVTAEGRADADPLASNKDAAGREQNRRIEVVLHRTAP